MLENKSKKRFGQNFLKNKYVIHKIVDALSGFDCAIDGVIEIGPGRGALTKALLTKYNVQAIEIDNDCVQFLQSESFESEIQAAIKVNKLQTKKLEIVNADFLQYSIGHVSSQCFVGNLPYNIGTKIIEKLVYAHVPCGVFMLQKEVAERITGISYSRLGIFVQARYDVQKVVDVSRNDFSPKPKIESQVIKLVAHNRLENVDLLVLNEFTKIMFAHRRKKLTSLKKMHPEIVEKLLQHSIDLNLRAEEIKKEIYYKLATK